MSSLEDRIRIEARRLGFALCGFARVGPAPHADAVRDWLRDGNAAEMAYMERRLAERLDVRRVWRHVRSVISVGRRYTPPPVPAIDWQGELRGRIAAYALGGDYHVSVARQLEKLAARVAELHPGALTRVYVDTGPLLEREWAAASGVGWFGKNTNILHTAEGSWFFLGELLTSLELEPDAPVEDRCGMCTRCLDLCPTAALKPGYVLDARRCISYLTIENRGPIARALRPQMGNWIFGCDICQEVCPWNEKLGRDRGAPQTADLFPFLPALLQLDEAQFLQRFRTSAVRRAKRDGLLRNVAVALGNTRNPGAVAPLATALAHDSSPLVRGHAAWALGTIGGRMARQALERARPTEPAAEVRAEVDAALEDRSEPPQISECTALTPGLPGMLGSAPRR